MNLRPVILSLACASTLACAADAPPEKMRWISANDVNLRAAPVPSGQIVARLHRGAEVALVRVVNESSFCEVDANVAAASKWRGFVACEFLALVPPPDRGTSLPANSRWVNGEGVNLRAKPALDAPIVARLTLNRRVEWIAQARENGFCEVRADVPSLRGFVACRFLSPEPLDANVVAVASLPNGEPNPQYDPYKAFWLQPGMRHLLAYGRQLGRQRSLEGIDLRAPQIVLPQVPEYEKMKARLGAGVIPPENPDWGRSWPADMLPLAVLQAGQMPADNVPNGLNGLPLAALQSLPLRAPAPSYFKGLAETLPIQATQWDVSARWQIPVGATFERGVILVGAEPAGGERLVPGLWDVAATTTQLRAPIYRVSLTRRGQMNVAFETLVQNNHVADALEMDSMCADYVDGFTFSDSNAVVVATERGAKADRKSFTAGDPVMFRFYARTPPTVRTAKAWQSEYPLNPEITSFKSATLVQFDIDGDGIPDAAVWEGIGPTNIVHLDNVVDDFPHRRVYFMNYAGQWYIVAHDFYGFGCGC
ncbi:MAG: hypothetical protein ACK5TK_13250 [Betaproteobacteria bacterium]